MPLSIVLLLWGLVWALPAYAAPVKVLAEVIFQDAAPGTVLVEIRMKHIPSGKRGRIGQEITSAQFADCAFVVAAVRARVIARAAELEPPLTLVDSDIAVIGGCQ